MSGLTSAYAHGPGRVITPVSKPDSPVVRGPRVPLPDVPIARLLTDVLSPARWEPWNQYNDHRAYPSPRSAYLVDVEIVAGDQRWPIDPVRRATIGEHTPPWNDVKRLAFRRHRERMNGYGEFADALVELETGHLIAALAEYAPRHGLAVTADADGITLKEGPQATVTIPRRSSGLGPRGLGADPRPLPATALATFAEAIVHDPRLRLRLAVHNVSGLEDGWYTLTPFRRVTAGRAMAAVQDAFGHPRHLIDVGGHNLALVITADIPAAGDEYPALLRAAGGCAQYACTAAARAGMFCRPVRSVTDETLEAATGAPLTHSLLYVLLAARPRALGFSYDLTPLEEQ